MLVRPVCSLQRRQSPRSVRISVRRDDAGGCFRFDARLQVLRVLRVLGAQVRSHEHAMRDRRRPRPRRGPSGTADARPGRVRCSCSGLRRTGGRATAPAGRRAQRQWRPSKRLGTCSSASAPMMVTALTSTSNPESLPDTSLATMTSMPLRSRLARARSTTSRVSAANPTSSGAVRPSRARQAATSRQNIRRRRQRQAERPVVVRDLLRRHAVRGVVGNRRRHHQRIGLRHGRQHGTMHLARPIGLESPRRRPEGRWRSAR